MNKKIPYGISDYKTIVEKEYLYVDKTKYVELFENLGEPYIFFLRPRRFGKSLFLSVLEYYYDINTKPDFENLFSNTYIGNKPTKERNSYYILYFNFSGINTSSKEVLQEDFTFKIINALTRFEGKYNLQIPIDTNAMPSSMFDMFLTKLSSKINSGHIYVLIDEYDHFANELLSFQVNVFQEVISQTGFVRKWYETLKIGTERGLIRKIFATGVSPVTLDSLTSGFNIAKNKTCDPRFNECLGFTHKEVEYVLKESLGSTLDIEKEMPNIKKYYNGYLFNESAKNRIFNSDMVLYYASEYSIKASPPKQLIDINISSDYKKIANLFTLQNKTQNFEVLKDIIEGNPQKCLITPEFSLSRNFTKDDFNSLLFYLGFLTINKSTILSLELTVPNYVIKELYFDFFGNLLKEEAQYNIDISNIRNSIEAIAVNGDINPFTEIVSATLNKLSNRDFINRIPDSGEVFTSPESWKPLSRSVSPLISPPERGGDISGDSYRIQFDEKYVKIIMVTYFMMSKVYYVQSEYEIPGNGYIDIALLPRSGIITPYNAIFEVKYIKKEDECNENILQKNITKAREQISKYSSISELAQMDNLLKWILVFCKDKLVYEEKVI